MEENNPYRVDVAGTAESDELLRKLEAKRLRGMVMTIVVLGLAGLGAVFAYGVITGDPDLVDESEETVAEDEWEDVEELALLSHSVDPAALASIDMAIVHGELFPDWIIASSNARYARDYDRADVIFQDLQRAVEADHNLTDILVELSGINSDGVITAPERVLQLFGAWNRYLDQNDIPFRVDPTVRSGRRRDWITARFYEVLHTIEPTVGGQPVRARLLVRADNLNIRELFVGQASTPEEGAVVVIDRVSDFALNQIWPLLVDSPHLDPIQRAFSPWVRQEVTGLLAPEHSALLQASALHRGDLLAVAASARERRTRCRSGYAFNFVPFDGFSEDSLARTERYAEADFGNNCPRVYPGEAQRLRASTVAIRDNLALPGALRALVAAAARKTIVHEARHVADGSRSGADGPLRCQSCDRHMSGDSVAELAAYLAAFAHPETAYLALFHACTLAEDLDGPHRRALDEILPRLLPTGCSGSIPAGLPDLAAGLERQLLGRSQAVQLPADLPSALPVTR